MSMFIMIFIGVFTASRYLISFMRMLRVSYTVVSYITIELRNFEGNCHFTGTLLSMLNYSNAPMTFLEGPLHLVAIQLLIKVLCSVARGESAKPEKGAGGSEIARANDPRRRL
jgi:hypothetical protein